MDIKVTQVESHRNGVGGEPFYAVRFTDAEEGAMLAVVFPPGPDDDGDASWKLDWSKGNPRVAVFKESLLPDITFGINSWRGDRYASALYEAIEQHHRVPTA